MSETTHEHVFGRGSNGTCRVDGCTHESQRGRQRRERRENRPTVSEPFDLYEALRMKSGFDHEGNAS